MKHPAIVRFVGNQENYKLGCGFRGWHYCRDCHRKAKCKKKQKNYGFTFGKEYKAYFLEYWQGKRVVYMLKITMEKL